VPRLNSYLYCQIVSRAASFLGERRSPLFSEVRRTSDEGDFD